MIRVGITSRKTGGAQNMHGVKDEVRKKKRQEEMAKALMDAQQKFQASQQAAQQGSAQFRGHAVAVVGGRCGWADAKRKEMGNHISEKCVFYEKMKI